MLIWETEPSEIQSMLIPIMGIQFTHYWVFKLHYRDKYSILGNILYIKNNSLCYNLFIEDIQWEYNTTHDRNRRYTMEYITTHGGNRR